uniref:Uncharacterized protein n=1 Tax=Biomphalaria glabrata TaxID=6526 RepID=A0A2C9LJW5_BIOGL
MRPTVYLVDPGQSKRKGSLTDIVHIMLIKAGYLLLVGALYVAGQTVSSEAENVSEEINSVPDVTDTDSEVNDFKQSLSDLGKKIFLNKVAAANEAAKWATATSQFSSPFVRDFNNLEEPLNTNRKRFDWPGRDTEDKERQQNINNRDAGDEIAKWAPLVFSIFGRDTDKLVEQLNKRDTADDIATWLPIAISLLDFFGRDTDKLVEQLNKRDTTDDIETWLPIAISLLDFFGRDTDKLVEQLNKRDTADDIETWLPIAISLLDFFWQRYRHAS